VPGASESFAGSAISASATATVDLAVPGASESFAGSAISASATGTVDLAVPGASETLTTANTPDPTGERVEPPLDARENTVTVTVSDSAAGATDDWAQPADTVTLTEASSGATDIWAQPSDTVTLTTSGIVQGVRPVLLTDAAVGETTEPVEGDVSVPDAAETLTVSAPTAEGMTDVWTQSSETLTVTEAATGITDLWVQASAELATLTATATATMTLDAHPSETLTLATTPDPTGTRDEYVGLEVPTAAETLTASAPVATGTLDPLLTEPAESLTLATTPDPTGELIEQSTELEGEPSAETVTVTAAAVGITDAWAQPADTVTLTEATTGATDSWAQPSETLTASATTADAQLQVLRAEALESALTLSETPDPTGTVIEEGAVAIPDAAETLTASASAEGRLLLLRANASETVTLANTPAPVGARVEVGAVEPAITPEDVALSETAEGRLSPLRISASETLTASEAAGVAVTPLLASASDTVTLTNLPPAQGQVFAGEPRDLIPPPLVELIYPFTGKVLPGHAVLEGGGGRLEPGLLTDSITLTTTGQVQGVTPVTLTDAAVGTVLDPEGVVNVPDAAESLTLRTEPAPQADVSEEGTLVAGPTERSWALTDHGIVQGVMPLTISDRAVGDVPSSVPWPVPPSEQLYPLRDVLTPADVEIGSWGLFLTEAVGAELHPLVMDGSETLTLTASADGNPGLSARYDEQLTLSTTPAPTGQRIDPVNLEVPDASEALTATDSGEGSEGLGTLWEDTLSLSEAVVGVLDPLVVAGTETVTLSAATMVDQDLAVVVSETLTAQSGWLIQFDPAGDALGSETLTLTAAASGALAVDVEASADPDRIWRVPAESRAWTLAGDPRTWTVGDDPRAWIVTTDTRIWTVNPDDTVGGVDD